jgi:hypothetical protein
MTSKMLTDREVRGLRGPVRLVVTRPSPGGPVQEEAFDRDGRLVGFREQPAAGSQSSFEYRYDAEGNRYDASGRRWGLPHIRTVRNPDGSRVEIVDVSMVAGWGPEGMHEVWFGTGGASTAETTFDLRGAPSGAVLRNAQGGELSRISCTCDGEGRIVDAVQYGGTSRPPLPGAPGLAVEDLPGDQRELARALFEPGSEQFRVAFRYDSFGRVVERIGSFAGREDERTVNAYNERGDIQTSTATTGTGTMVYEFDYDYDEYGNWIRQTSRYMSGGSMAGSHEFSRTIAYYD